VSDSSLNNHGYGACFVADPRSIFFDTPVIHFRKYWSVCSLCKITVYRQLFWNRWAPPALPPRARWVAGYALPGRAETPGFIM